MSIFRSSIYHLADYLWTIVHHHWRPNSTVHESRLEAREELEELTGAILEHHYCFSDNADNHGFDDDNIKLAAWTFCKEDTEEGAMLPEYDGSLGSYFEASHDSGIEIALNEVEDCIPKEKVQDYSCGSLVFGAWKQCYGNDGRGGAVDSQCLRFSVRPYWLPDGEFTLGEEWDGNEMDKDILAGVNFDEE